MLWLRKGFGVKRIPVVKGQAMPAYDPRAVKGMGVTYATSTMGADHTAGYCTGANILGVGGKVDPLHVEGQVDLSRNLQIATAALDSTGLCLFVAFPVLDDPTALVSICEMISAKYGVPYTADDFIELEKRCSGRSGISTPVPDSPKSMTGSPSSLNWNRFRRIMWSLTYRMGLDQVFNF